MQNYIQLIEVVIKLFIEAIKLSTNGHSVLQKSKLNFSSKILENNMIYDALG